MSVNNICQGCLSTDRRLTPIGNHGKLYQLLLLTKLNSHVKKQIKLCWECHRIVEKIHAFRLRITKAQKLLNEMHVDYKPLSSLAPSSLLNDYKMIIYEDIKDTIPIELQTDTVKEEKLEGLYYTDETVQQSGISDNADQSFGLFKTEIVKDEVDDFHFDDSEMIDDTEVDDKDLKRVSEPLVSIEELEKKAEIVVVNRFRKKPSVLKKKYRTILMGDIPDKRKLYDKVKIDQKGLEEWMEKKRKSRNWKRFQCERCFCGFSKQEYYDKHLAVRHAKRLGNYECDVCGFRFAEKCKLAYHVRSHFVKFVCKLCGYESYLRNQMYLHFVHGPHGRQMECKKCGMRFDCRRPREFFDHYRRMHKTHICDHCGKKYSKKSKIITHIKKYHTVHRCNICNTTYATLDSYNRHHNEKHVIDVSEQNYCVECNMQFINRSQYNIHLKRSIKHRPTPKIPCPECGKVYTKKISMVNHYKLVHLKKTDYHCALCDTYFLTGYRLRYHQKYFHEKKPKVKNKLCKYCGKGFNTNRILNNHVRTHTGERPYACALCPAAFTQKQSLTSHERSAHK